MLLKKSIPTDRGDDKCSISTIGVAKGIKKWTSKEVAHSLPSKGPPSILLALFALTPYLRRTIQHARLAPVSRSSRRARTPRHTHPLAQAPIVTAGCDLAQRSGGSIEQIRPGDVISLAPGQKHWHGATASTAMTHIAIQEQLDGKTVDWMEQVSDEQYQAPKVNK